METRLGSRALKGWMCAVAVASVVAGPAHAVDSVKIGVIQPLSGPNAQFGIASRNGTELAAQIINEAGGIKSLGGAKIELVSVDTPTPNSAAAATQRLISRTKVAGVVGAFVSSTTLAASEVTERAGVPLVTFAFADQITGRGYKHVFQVTPKGTVFGEKQFSYTVDLLKQAGRRVNKVALFYEDTAYGTAQAQGLRTAAKEAGVEVVVDEAYPLGITDVNPLINRLRASGADIVFPVSYLNDSLLIIRAMRQQNITIPVVGGAAGYIIPDFKKGLGDYAEGTLSVASASWDQVPELAARYKEKYGSFMTHEALSHAAALNVLATAIETAKSADPAKVTTALASINDCSAVAKAVPGNCIKFDKTGLNENSFPLLVQWRGDAPVTVYPPSVAKAQPVLPKP